MTDRERLIEILRVPIYPHELADPAEVVADYLLDNGVTIPVRCNDCKWYKPKGGVAGQKTIICSYQPKDFFCAYGERKDNESKAD